MNHSQGNGLLKSLEDTDNGGPVSPGTGVGDVEMVPTSLSLEPRGPIAGHKVVKLSVGGHC